MSFVFVMYFPCISTLNYFFVIIMCNVYGKTLIYAQSRAISTGISFCCLFNTVTFCGVFKVTEM